jgi:hypothetical protein
MLILKIHSMPCLIANRRWDEKMSNVEASTWYLCTPEALWKQR